MDTEGIAVYRVGEKIWGIAACDVAEFMDGDLPSIGMLQIFQVGYDLFYVGKHGLLLGYGLRAGFLLSGCDFQ